MEMAATKFKGTGSIIQRALCTLQTDELSRCISGTLGLLEKARFAVLHFVVIAFGKFDLAINVKSRCYKLSGSPQGCKTQGGTRF